MNDKFFSKTIKRALFGFFLGTTLVAGAALTTAFMEPGTAPSSSREPSDSIDQGDWNAHGRAWVPNESGNGTSTLSESACDDATNWKWFEDGNGDGDTTDEEDGICVLTVAIDSGILSWNGYDWGTDFDNSYIAGYECEGNFPTGTVKSGTYNGLDAAGDPDTTWNSGDCALCQADCFDGKKDLPDQGSYTSNAGGVGGYQGPITPEVLKNWKGTRLPTFNDFYGFCGYKDGGSDYETGCSSVSSHGDNGQMNGRTDECLDLSNSASHEWLSEQLSNYTARMAGYYACSYSHAYYVSSAYRFRAVFRP